MDVDHVSEVGQVGRVLWNHRMWWQQAPFVHHRLDWEALEPEAAAWLRGLDDDQLQALDEGALPLHPVLAPVRAAAEAMSRVPVLERHPVDGLSPFWHRGVKGRKLGQVQAFLATVDGVLAHGDGPVVEWCSGVGHLGRLAAWTHERPGLLLEKDPALCRPYVGRGVEVPAIPVEHRCVDVLEDDVHHMVPEAGAILGLHACGRLSDRLAEVGHRSGARVLAFSPCCSHRRFSSAPWQAMSEAGRATGLQLDDMALRLSVLDVGPSPGRRVERRRIQRIHRVAADLLAREATGVDAYHGFASVPRPWSDLPMGEFIERIRARHDWPVPDDWDPDELLRRATTLDRQMRALGVVRGWFRRPLERFLVQDRAAWLQEQGWQVRMGTFCERSLTPRNLMVVAHRA